MNLITLLWIVVLGVALWAVVRYVKRPEPRYVALRDTLLLIIKTGIVIWAIVAFRAVDLHAQQVTLACASTDTIIVSRAQTAAVCAAKANAPPPLVVATAPGAIEPTGMTRLAERDFTTLALSPWYSQSGYTGAIALAIDAAAPKSGPTVMRQNFTSQLPGGSSPGTVGVGLNPQPRVIYVSMWMLLSSNFQGHTVTNKVLHWWTGGSNRAILAIAGAGTARLTTRVGFQRLAIPYQGATEKNLESLCEVKRGQWHRYEAVLTTNTPGVADGSFSYWLDGIPCGAYAGIGYVGAGQNGRWEEFMWSPTWGGVGGTITQSFFAAVDHIYISGK